MTVNLPIRDRGTELQVSAVLSIHQGKIETFKSIANRCIESVIQKDTETLQYDWFLDEQNHKCIVRERYTSSDAALAHMANLGNLLGELS